MNRLISLMRKLRDDARGNIVEYTVILGLILAVAITALTALGTNAASELTEIAETISPGTP